MESSILIRTLPPKPNKLHYFSPPVGTTNKHSVASSRFPFPRRCRELRVMPVNKPPSSFGSSSSSPQTPGFGGLDLEWLPAFPHVLTASMANFLFGYHIGVMNGPIEAIARELGFEGKPFLEGLVVSIFIVGAFIGSTGSAAFIDKLGCRRSLQIATIPLIIGALLRFLSVCFNLHHLDL
ncbi:putative plastidic glucose transporter 1 [Iris pallida]|uniref:Plastidic glucose transporter 1 n=1 Tax=Iris pallida TaxID=29817 RepID=A0AAX6EYV9_IRIPA|nr:putative plastidic glucose transporter 1 [Iris pallida]